MHSRQNRINGIIRYPKSFGSFFLHISVRTKYRLPAGM